MKAFMSKLKVLVVSERRGRELANEYHRAGVKSDCLPLYVQLTPEGLAMGLGGPRNLKRYGIVVGAALEFWLVRRLGEKSAHRYHKALWQEKPMGRRPLTSKICDEFTDLKISRQAKYARRKRRNNAKPYQLSKRT